MTNHHIHTLAVCAALTASALTSSARAQGAPPTSAQAAPTATVNAASLDKARDLFTQANALYDVNKYPQAEAAYQAAWKIKKSFDLAGNFGNLEADMNKPRSAAELLSFAVREFPAGGKPAVRDALVKRLGEVLKLVGTLRLTVNKPGAEVFLDGVSVGSAPIQGDVYLDPGTHNVEARLDGLMPAQVTFTAAKGKSQGVELTLVPPPGASTPVLVAGGAVAGAGVVAGAVLLGVSFTKKGSAADLASSKQVGCPVAGTGAMGACKNVANAVTSRNALANAGLWALVGGGVAGVSTLIYGLAGGSKAPRTGVRVLPVVTGDGGGLVVGGTF